MSKYNLRSGAAAQEPPISQTASNPDLENDNEQELDTTVIETTQRTHASEENNQLCAIMADLAELTRAVTESRRDIDLLRIHIQHHSPTDQLQQQPPRFGQTGLVSTQQEPLMFEDQRDIFTC